MKRATCAAIAVGGLFALVGSGSPVAAQAAAPSPVENMTSAKALFERSCGVCHGLERPLSKTFDRAGWEKTVERMHDTGAEVNKDERAQIVAYLLTKNTFEAKCSFCHPTDRPLGKSKSAADWLATAQRMSEKKPGHLTEAEVADVAAYLAITRPLP
jgi:mono/diheme cytochrome c family protein